MYCTGAAMCQAAPLHLLRAAVLGQQAKVEICQTPLQERGARPQLLSFYSPYFLPFRIKFRLLSIRSKLGSPSIEKIARKEEYL